MEDPCLSTNYTDALALRRYNFFKWLIPVLLAALLLGLWGVAQRYAAIADPTLTGPTGIIEPAPITLSGTGTADSDIDVRLGGNSIGSTTVDSSGNWSLDTDTTLNTGDYEFQAFALDPDGVVRGESNPLALTVATADMAEPEIAYNLPTLTLPSGDIDPTAVTITGTGTPGSTIELFNNGISLGTTTVDADGNWSFDISLDGPDHEFEAIAFTPDGAEVGSSGKFALTLPAALAALTLNPPELGELSLGAADLPGGSYTLSGTGEPNANIAISLDGTDVGTAVVDADGNWTFTGDVELPPGSYDIDVRMLDDGGNELDNAVSTLNIPAIDSGPVITVNSVETDPVTGAIRLNGSALPGEELEILANGEVIGTATADDDGNWSFDPRLPLGEYQFQARTVGTPDRISPPLAGEVIPFVTLPTVDVTDDTENNVTAAGRTVPNGNVDVYIDGEYVDTVTADANGNWNYTTTLGDGRHVIVGRVVNDAGEPVAEAANTANVGDVPSGVTVVYGEVGTEDDDTVTTIALAGSPAVEIIFDASWSMSQNFAGESRVSAAREALSNIVNSVLPEGTPIALRAFGNIEGNFSCRTDLMYPYQELNRDELNTIISDLNPQFNANTPLAASLALVAEDMAASEEEERIVVVLTDGEETCDGNPAAAIQELVDAGFNVQVNIVGLSIAEQRLKDEFARWAEIGGGQYFDVTEPGELTSALRAATGAFYLVRDADGNSVATGRVGGQPVTLDPGTYTIEVKTSPATLIEDVEIGEGEVLQIVLR